MALKNSSASQIRRNASLAGVEALRRTLSLKVQLKRIMIAAYRQLITGREPIISSPSCLSVGNVGRKSGEMQKQEGEQPRTKRGMRKFAEVRYKPLQNRSLSDQVRDHEVHLGDAHAVNLSIHHLRAHQHSLQQSAAKRDIIRIRRGSRSSLLRSTQSRTR